MCDTVIEEIQDFELVLKQVGDHMGSIRILESTEAQACLEDWTPAFAGVTKGTGPRPPLDKGGLQGGFLCRVFTSTLTRLCSRKGVATPPVSLCSSSASFEDENEYDDEDDFQVMLRRFPVA